MKYEYFVANKLLEGNTKQNLSNPFIRITIIAIALSLTIMIVAMAIITGFKTEIKSKVYGFGGHIQITNYDSNQSFESQPIYSDLQCIDQVKDIKEVERVQIYATKAGIVKTSTEIQGVVIKGVSTDFDWNFFKKSIVEGSTFEISDTSTTNQTLISKTLANMLHLKVGDTYDVFFVQNPPRYRRFKVAGIYNTQMAEFDKMFIIGDIKHLQKLNGWQANQITGFEIYINNLNRLDEIRWKVDDIAGTIFFEDYSKLKVMSITEKYPSIFDWVNLQDLNAAVLIILMLVVAGINMISGLLIIILEKTGTIGLLKSLGANNNSIRKIFLVQSGRIMAKGLLIGNIVGIGVCLLQKYSGLIKLDEAYYYLSQVPISIVPWHIIVLNIAAFAVGMAMLTFPSMVISHISPDKSLKFE